MSITQTIQIADKPTLDNIKSSIDNNTYGLQAIKAAIDNSGGGGASPTIMIVDSDGSKAGKALTIFDDNGLFEYTVEFPNDGTKYIKYPVDYLTVWYISYQGGLEKSNVNTFGGTTAKPFSVPTWANGTDDEIANMVNWDEIGKIDLSNYWSVNDERQVNIASISASGTYDGTSWSVGESQISQTITLVLMDTNVYDLVTPTPNGRTKSKFVVGMKGCLQYNGYMNSTNVNAGSWNSCARRRWCNGGFRRAIPSTLRPIFKQFKTPTIGDYNGSIILYSNDYFALWAEKEVFGSRTYSNTTEANALTHIAYYRTASNRIKTTNGSNYSWWERSPYASGTSYFCCVYNNGTVSVDYASGGYGLAVFGCI